MPIALPGLPRTADVKPRLVRFGGDLTPTLGGPVSRIVRLGSRYAVDVNLPALSATDARAWLAARLQADTLGSTLTLAFPQPDYDGVAGAPLVDGAGQSGATLHVRGLAPGALIEGGVFFSFATASRLYLHAVAATVQAGTDGRAALPIAPMLRAQPADAAALNFATPQLEGLLEGQSIDWSLARLRWVGLGFTLSENA